MDLEILRITSQVAGIGGLSLGVFLLLFGSIIKKIIAPRFKNEELAYRLWRLILILVWSIAVIGISGWIYINQPKNNLPTPSISKSEAKVSSVLTQLNFLIVYVENPPSGDAAVLINEKDINTQLKAENTFTGEKIYHFEGSPDQLNLRVGNNQVIVKYGSITLPKFEFKYTAMQKQETQRYFEQIQRTEILKKKNEAIIKKYFGPG